MKVAPLTAARLLLGALALALLTGQVQASAIRTDTGFTTNTFARNDDGSISVNTGINFDFFGINGPSLYLNNNGNVTFGGGLSAYTPSGITGGSTPMIAPFFADVDTRYSGDPVTYGTSTVDGHTAFGIDWVNVAYYNSGTAVSTDSFQLVLIDRSDTGAGNFDFEFNYDSILWDTGDASGGTGGLGGTSAHVGYTNGAGTYYEFAGSGVNDAFLNTGPAGTSLIQNSLNSSVSGRYLFHVRNGAVTSVPEPASLALLGLGLFGIGFSRRRKA